MLLNNLYYYLRPIIPRRIQIALRRRVVSQKMEYYSGIWPIDRNAGVAPVRFEGWQDKKRFALVLTHDVETKRGHDKCRQLIAMEEKLGFRSTFNFVPRRYNVSEDLRRYLRENGFEVGVHGLYHDGKLYRSRSIFVKRSAQINRFMKEWHAVGFRSPSMHKNLEWIHDLDIEYDSSTFDTDPFEPDSDGVSLIFPFLVSDDPTGRNYIELPYTMPQDSTLFILMREKSTDIWKKKLDWIVEKGGMAYMTTHPDYMNFGGGRCATDEYPADYYSEFLNYVKDKYDFKQL